MALTLADGDGSKPLAPAELLASAPLVTCAVRCILARVPATGSP